MLVTRKVEQAGIYHMPQTCRERRLPAARAGNSIPYTYVPYKENVLETFNGINAYSYSISGNMLYVP